MFPDYLSVSYDHVDCKVFLLSMFWTENWDDHIDCLLLILTSEFIYYNPFLKVSDSALSHARDLEMMKLCCLSFKLVLTEYVPSSPNVLSKFC